MGYFGRNASILNLGPEDLGSVVLSPDVKHEDAGDEQEGHDENGNWSNFDSG